MKTDVGALVEPFAVGYHGRIGLADIVDRGFREPIDNKEENVKILVSPRDLS